MNDLITSFARHGLTFIGGYLVAKGFVGPEAVDAFVAGNVAIVSGLATYAVGQVMSLKRLFS